MTNCETGTKQTLPHNRRVSTLFSQGEVAWNGGEPTPGARFSKVPVTFRVSDPKSSIQIKSKENKRRS